ncbi:putative porin [Mariniflexile sp.]|uniref:putative porin n=1 Tax=Mariniflexile sp. TaxID=1979402 RepID=UPI0040488410
MHLRIIFFLFLISWPFTLISQNETPSKLQFNADFRFRVEEDWNSKKSDGSFRDDRTRWRYKARAGFQYDYNHWASFGARIRTGNPMKQQDPQLTLGDDFSEFNILPIGFEKIYFKAEQDGYAFWIGKNTFPFEKQNELFWSDNVYPEGVFLKKKFKMQTGVLNNLDLSGGHFILRTNGTSLDKDSYFQGLQIATSLLDKKAKLYGGMYQFKNIPNIPDGAETFVFDYSILNIGTNISLLKSHDLNLELDYYNNLKNYGSNDSIAPNLKNQKRGFVTGLNIGHLSKKSDYAFKVTYSYLEKYAAVDFLAQNDWARWDYSSFNSPDGRLTNLKGVELVGSYLLDKNIKLTLKYYKVNQLITSGTAKETGDRIRLDLDVKF